jgi:hypothetical protein
LHEVALPLQTTNGYISVIVTNRGQAFYRLRMR